MKFFILSFFILAMTTCSNPFYDDEKLKDPDEITEIRVDPLNKQLYGPGEEITLSGETVRIFRRNGKIEERLLKKSDLSGFDPFREGIQTITVSVDGEKRYFDIALKIFPPLPIGPFPTSIELDVDALWKVSVYNHLTKGIRNTFSDSGQTVQFILENMDQAGDGDIVAVYITYKKHTYCRFYVVSIP